MKTEKTQQEAFSLLKRCQETFDINTSIEMPLFLNRISILNDKIKSLLSKTDCTESVYKDCKEFVERIDNSYLPSINNISQPEKEPDEKECPMNNLIDRLTTMYPLVSSKLDTNVDFGNKVPNIFQQYQSAFRKEGITMDTWHGKNDTFYYVVEHKDGNFYNSEKESNYEFEQTSQMACIEKAFEMCNKKIFEAMPYKESSENESKIDNSIIFYNDLMNLINNHCKEGLSKKELVSKMEYALTSCKMS